MNKKDILKEILIKKNMEYINKYAELISLNWYKWDYNIILDDLFYVSKINNLIDQNFFFDRTFYDKKEILKKLVENIAGVSDLWNWEYKLSIDSLLSTITNFLWINSWINIYEIQFKKEDISQKIYKTEFLLNKDWEFYLLNLKKDNSQWLLEEIKKIVNQKIINKYGLIKQWEKILNPITKVDQYKDLLLSQIPKVIQKEFDTYDYTELYNNINMDYFLRTSFIEENYINTHWLDALFKWIEDWRRIVIYGDYDSDWFNSAFQLHKLFKSIWYNNFVIIFPTREKKYINVIDWKEMTSDFTWYGITKEISWFVTKNDLLITVDNGWAQVDVFNDLLEKWINIPTIIIDHHNLSYSNNKEMKNNYRLEKMFIREAWIKLDKIDSNQIILLKEDFPIYYNHPYIKAEFNWVAATIMTWLFILEFLKRYNDKLWLKDNYTTLLENLIIHAGIWQITDVMSLLPTTKNVWLLIYILAKKTFQKSLDEITKTLKTNGVSEIDWWKMLSFNAQYSRLSDIKKKNIKAVIKGTLFTPYNIDWNWKIVYSAINKEVLLLMYSKKIWVLNVWNIGWMIWPLINIIWRTSSLSELMKYLVYITEDQSSYTTKLPVISNFTKIADVTVIRRETVNEWKRLLGKFIEVFTDIDSNDYLYLPENYLKILFLTNSNEFNFKEFNKLNNLYRKLIDQWVIKNKKDLYTVANKYWLSKEQIRLFNKGIIDFISPFNWLVSSKISEAYNVNTIVASSVLSRYNNWLSFHGSGRWIWNINLNQFIQDIKSSLKNKNISIDGGWHAWAVWLWMNIKMSERIFSYEELLDKYYWIEETVKDYIYKKLNLTNWKINSENIDNIIDFYKPIIFRNVINLYQWDNLTGFIKDLFSLANKFWVFWSDFSWKPIYIHFDTWLKQIVENNSITNYDNINYVINGVKLYVNMYTKRVAKDALKKKDYKWLSNNYKFIKIDIIEDSKGVSGFNYELI